MSEAQFRSLIAGEIYATKLFEAYAQEVEPNVQQVKGRYIVTDDTATAESLVARLMAGETFEELEAEVEADDAEEPIARVGSFDWSPLETLTQRFGTDYATAAFDTEAGETVTDLLVSPTGQLYLIFVEGNEIRELPDYLIEQQQVQLIQAWLDEQKLGEGIVYGNWRPYIPREPSLP
jgi:parvulin-like peptidyl-prolyl isomerase